jgi:hypothetical protein
MILPTHLTLKGKEQALLNCDYMFVNTIASYWKMAGKEAATYCSYCSTDFRNSICFADRKTI